MLARGARKKQLQAFDLCDGTKGQGAIAKALGLAAGNFSRTVGRWVAEGVLVRMGDGRDAKLLHVDPLLEGVLKN